MRRPIQRIATFLSSILLGSVRLRVLHNHWTLDFARHSSIEIIVSAWQQQINWRLFCEKPFQINQSVAAAAPLKGFSGRQQFSTSGPFGSCRTSWTKNKHGRQPVFFWFFFKRSPWWWKRRRPKMLEKVEKNGKKKGATVMAASGTAGQRLLRCRIGHHS